jgi:hypothetical protein
VGMCDFTICFSFLKENNFSLIKKSDSDKKKALKGWAYLLKMA